MHDGGSEGVNLARVGLPGEIVPGCLVAFADLVSVQQIAGMLEQLGEEAVMD